MSCHWVCLPLQDLELELQHALSGAAPAGLIPAILQAASLLQPVPITLEDLLARAPDVLSEAAARLGSNSAGSSNGGVPDSSEMGPQPVFNTDEEWNSYYASHMFCGGHHSSFYRKYCPSFDQFIQCVTNQQQKLQWFNYVMYPLQKQLLPFRNRALVSADAIPWFLEAFPGLQSHIPEAFTKHPAHASHCTHPVRTVLWHAAPANVPYAMERSFNPIIKPESQWLESLEMNDWSNESHSPLSMQCITDYIYRAPVEALSTADRPCRLPLAAARNLALTKLMVFSPFCVRDFIAATFRYEFLQRACLIPAVVTLAPGPATQYIPPAQKQLILQATSNAQLSPANFPSVFDLQPFAHMFFAYLAAEPDENTKEYWDLMKVFSDKLSKRQGIQLHARSVDGTRVSYEQEIKLPSVRLAALFASQPPIMVNDPVAPHAQGSMQTPARPVWQQQSALYTPASQSSRYQPYGNRVEYSAGRSRGRPRGRRGR